MSTPRFSSLPEWLSWMEQLHPSEIDLGLDRIRQVANHLGIRKPNAKVITVAGTNGKGSFVASLNALLLANNRKVACYTSPHLLRYNERMVINGECVADNELCEVFEQIDRARGDISLTYFEFGTLAALLLFSRCQLDYWLLEVGLGGRLDAVNLIDPDVSVITSIAMDHENWLGNTRESIALEKFGILRPGGICICAEPDVPNGANRLAEQLGGQLFRINRDFSFRSEGENPIAKITVSRLASELEFEIDTKKMTLALPSVAAALQVYALYETEYETEIPALTCQNILQNISFSGRFEQVDWDGVQVILDVAHNPAAMIELAYALNRNGYNCCNVVVAMMSDKNIGESLSNLQGGKLEVGAREHSGSNQLSNIAGWYVSEIPSLPRSAKKEDLARHLRDICVEREDIYTAASPTDAFIAAVKNLKSEGDSVKRKASAVLVTGSFFTVAEVKKLMQPK